MGTSSEHWASGLWTVKAGSEDEFVARWRTWLDWTSKNTAGFRSATLIRSDADGRRFESFSDWDSADERAAWESSAGFRDLMAPVRELCDDVQAGNFTTAASF